jgi:hypothetical protein
VAPILIVLGGAFSKIEIAVRPTQCSLCPDSDQVSQHGEMARRPISGIMRSLRVAPHRRSQIEPIASPYDAS